jgi:ubiquitin C-terminal hydrolase
LCSCCKKKKKSTKKMTIYKFPPVLVVHIKRFTQKTKINTRVKFPTERLDMTAFSAVNQIEIAPIYDLYAVSNHIGGLNGGHYTATCLNPQSKLWYCFNDSLVSQTDPRELMKDGFPYLLFYRRREA